MINDKNKPMLIQKIVPAIIALVMGLSFSASAGTPKVEAKDAKTEKPALKSETNEPTLYWYEVSYDDPGHPDGYIKENTDVFDVGEKSNISNPCASGNAKDCLRGFATELTTFPVYSGGDGEIRRSN
jgi:hypothetical protein